MTQTAHRIPGQRADARRPGAIYLHMTRRVDRRGLPVNGTEKGYVGRSRDVARRTGQHAGILPQRDGTIVESPWFDLKVGETQILEQGMFTDAGLDDRERYWIAALQPRYCDRDNPCPDRIRKFEARRHRDARDAARGLPPRQWPPVQVDPVAPGRVWPLVKRVLRSPWTWWLAGWLFTALAFGWLLGDLADAAGERLPSAWQSGIAAVVAAGAVGRLWWWVSGRRWWRRVKRRRRS